MSVTKHEEQRDDSRPVRFVRVCCDFCKKTIAEYEGSSKQAARRWAKQEGARLANDKDFCEDNCYWKYENQKIGAGSLSITGAK